VSANDILDRLLAPERQRIEELSASLYDRSAENGQLRDKLARLEKLLCADCGKRWKDER
jgi:hypothetical protein